MGFALTIVQQAYEALSHQDIPAVLDLVADEVDSDFIGSASLPYSGWRQSRKELAKPKRAGRLFRCSRTSRRHSRVGIAQILSRDGAAEETTCMKLDMMR